MPILDFSVLDRAQKELRKQERRTMEMQETAAAQLALRKIDREHHEQLQEQSRIRTATALTMAGILVPGRRGSTRSLMALDAPRGSDSDQLKIEEIGVDDTQVAELQKQLARADARAEAAEAKVPDRRLNSLITAVMAKIETLDDDRTKARFLRSLSFTVEKWDPGFKGLGKVANTGGKKATEAAAAKVRKAGGKAGGKADKPGKPAEPADDDSDDSDGI